MPTPGLPSRAGAGDVPRRLGVRPAMATPAGLQHHSGRMPGTRGQLPVAAPSSPARPCCTSRRLDADRRAAAARAGACTSSSACNSALFLPLLRGQAVGVAGARHRPGARLPPRQVALAESFRDQAVIAIENVRLFNETKEALERRRASAPRYCTVISNSVADAPPVFEAILPGVPAAVPDASTWASRWWTTTAWCIHGRWSGRRAAIADRNWARLNEPAFPRPLAQSARPIRSASAGAALPRPGLDGPGTCPRPCAPSHARLGNFAAAVRAHAVGGPRHRRDPPGSPSAAPFTDKEIALARRPSPTRP